MFNRFVDMKAKENFRNFKIFKWAYFDDFFTDKTMYCYSYTFKDDTQYIYYPLGKRYVVVSSIRVSSIVDNYLRGYASTLINTDYDSRHFCEYWLDCNNVIQLRLFTFSKKKGWILKDKYSTKYLADLSRSHIYKYLSPKQIEELESKLYLALINKLL